jgi:uncharacterized protein YgfB (UPF0149 family)
MTLPATPSYERTARQMAGAGIEAGPAEAHGLACGLICGGVENALARLEAELFDAADAGDVLATECRRSLAGLLERTLGEMDGEGMGFTPFLPGDERPLSERATAIREWCEGFMYGFGLSGIAPQGALSGEGREALRDFGELTRLDAEHVGQDEDEGEEEALTEIVEFVRVAAMLIREEVLQYREAHR